MEAISIIGFLSFVVFLIMSIVSLFKKNGKEKRNLLISVTCFVVFLIGAFNTDMGTSPTNKPVTASEDSTDPSKTAGNDEQKENSESSENEKSNEPTEEEWQESYRKIMMNEARTYIQLTVRGTISKDRYNSSVGVLNQQLNKLKGDDKAKYDELVKAVEKDDLKTAKDKYTALGGEDFEDLHKDPKPKEVEKPEEAKTEDVPREHKSALKKAEQYAEVMSMSKAGIYDQLTSEYGENFPKEAAQYAIDNIVFDWKENALKKAKQYAESMNMSDDAIYDQLISEYGEKFTKEEAQYAIDNLE
ncbi:hypothetical protein M2277_005361 [Paenibacillus sp. LBL]|nr:hypothetical protein [Paenibacillus sp. LBL]